MKPSPSSILARQQASWNRSSAGWRKWDRLMTDFAKPVNDEMIRLLDIRSHSAVLDVASGTGEPGLSIAEIATAGRVTGFDLSEGMLKIAESKAEKRGLRNYETVIGDVSQLPFGDNAFDAVSCRYGFMFFPDMQAAAREMMRVLRPGGRIAVAVWNVPEKNPWGTIIGEVIRKNLRLPSPREDAPGIFRCAKAGMMAGLFREAGLQNISEEEVPSCFNCGTAEDYWSFHTEAGAPVAAALSKADNTMKEKIRAEVTGLVSQKYPGNNIMIAASSLVICGEKQ